MDKITWTLALIIMSLSQIANAECSESTLQTDFSTVRQQLLEGSIKQAQGTLFSIRETIHCHTFTTSEYQQFLFYTAIYHHLLSNPHLAEHYFMGSNPSLHPSFGDSIQEYASVFQSSRAHWPHIIAHSRFQELFINGKKSNPHVTLPKGTHLLQLVHQKTKQPLYSKWITVQEDAPKKITTPRFPPQWPLYLGGTQTVLAGYSLWMAKQKHDEAQKTEQAEDYHVINKQKKNWLLLSGGFSVLGTVFFGVYYVW